MSKTSADELLSKINAALKSVNLSIVPLNSRDKKEKHTSNRPNSDDSNSESEYSSEEPVNDTMLSVNFVDELQKAKATDADSDASVWEGLSDVDTITSEELETVVKNVLNTLIKEHPKKYETPATNTEDSWYEEINRMDIKERPKEYETPATNTEGPWYEEINRMDIKERPKEYETPATNTEYPWYEEINRMDEKEHPKEYETPATHTECPWSEEINRMDIKEHPKDYETPATHSECPWYKEINRMDNLTAMRYIDAIVRKSIEPESDSGVSEIVCEDDTKINKKFQNIFDDYASRLNQLFRTGANGPETETETEAETESEAETEVKVDTEEYKCEEAFVCKQVRFGSTCNLHRNETDCETSDSECAPSTEKVFKKTSQCLIYSEAESDLSECESAAEADAVYEKNLDNIINFLKNNIQQELSDSETDVSVSESACEFKINSEKAPDEVPVYFIYPVQSKDIIQTDSESDSDSSADVEISKELEFIMTTYINGRIKEEIGESETDTESTCSLK